MLNISLIYAFYYISFFFVFCLFVFCLFYNESLVSLRASQTDMNDKEDTKKTNNSCRILSHVLLSQLDVGYFNIITRIVSKYTSYTRRVRKGIAMLSRKRINAQNTIDFCIMLRQTNPGTTFLLILCRSCLRRNGYYIQLLTSHLAVRYPLNNPSKTKND